MCGGWGVASPLRPNGRVQRRAAPRAPCFARGVTHECVRCNSLLNSIRLRRIGKLPSQRFLDTKFFFERTLGRDWKLFDLVRPAREKNGTHKYTSEPEF